MSSIARQTAQKSYMLMTSYEMRQCWSCGLTTGCMQASAQQCSPLMNGCQSIKLTSELGLSNDTGDEQVDTQLIGKGKKLSGADKRTSMLQVSGFLPATANSRSVSVSIEAIELCSFTLAHKHGNELLWSEAHKRSKTSCGSAFDCNGHGHIPMRLR